MNTVRILIAALAVAAGVVISQTVNRKEAPPVPEPSTAGPARAPLPEERFVSVRRVRPFHGIAIQLHRAQGAVETYGRLIRDVADLGADTILISVDVYQKHAGSLRVEIDPERIPSRSDLLALHNIAADAGLRVVLMPKVLLAEPRGNEWRGVIQPASWDPWFESYGAFLEYIADIGRQGHAEMLMVGSELVSTEKYTKRWKELIARVRRKFPGLLGYSANWDHYKTIEFWEDLDLLALTTYYKLADEPNPTVDQLVESWKPIRQEILEWQATIGKPLFFSEAGWCSQEGATEFPWNYYHNEKATPAGHQEQKRAYEAFIRTWKDVRQVGGVIWWEWTDAPGGKDDYGYTARGKPAEAVLRHWFADIARTDEPSGPGADPEPAKDLQTDPDTPDE